MLLTFLFACVESEPNYVSKADLDRAMAGGDTPALCAGLRMKEPETREHAADKLETYGLPADCLCERLQYEGRWDAPILSGLAGGKDAEKLACVGALLDDAAQPERTALVGAVQKIPALRPRLVQAATSDADAAVRAAAMPVFRNSKDAAEIALVTGWLASDPSPVVRAAAAGALFSQAPGTDALRTAVGTDADPAVRAAALASLQSVKPDDFDTTVCSALINDAAPEVRVAALESMRATRDPEQLACITERLGKEEAAPEVRAALLKTLTSSADPIAAKALCDAIPAWVKLYVKDTAPSEGEDILKAQNNRDFEKSYDCVQSALKQGGGYTCQGRAYVASFFRELGGKAAVPTCGAGGGGRAAPSNEITF